MVHIVLPNSEGKDISNSAEFAGTAIPLLLKKIDISNNSKRGKCG